MTTEIIGSFSFSKTHYNNLQGEFLCKGTEQVRVETSILKTEPIKDSFEGTYVSIWFDTKQHFGDLKIKPAKNGIYELTWEQASIPIYKGEAFISHSNLIGHYWSV